MAIPQARSRRRRGPRGLPIVLGLVLIALVFRGMRVDSTPLPSGNPTSTSGDTPMPVNAAGVTFAPGACLRYAPTSGDQHHIVFIDPGHGGQDPGASGTDGVVTIYEKDVTLAVGLDLMALLRADGYTVAMARTTDTLVARTKAGDLNGKLLTSAGEHRDIEARVACANAAGAQALLSIHFNAYDDPTVNGAETIYDTARPFSAENRRLATLAQSDVVDQLHKAGWAVPDRGILDDIAAGTPALTAEGAAYGHLLELGPAAGSWLANPSTMPGVLIEPLFLTHPAEAAVATSKPGQHAMAVGLARAVDAFFSAPSRSAA